MKNNYLQSYKDLLTNPILFIPDIITIVYSFLLAYFLAWYTGLVDFIKNQNTLNLLTQSDLNPIITALTGHLETNFGKIIFSIILFFITTFLVGTGMLTVKFNLITEIVKGKKTTLKQIFNLRSKNFYQVLIMRIITFISVMVFTTLILILGSIFYAIHPYLVYLLTPLPFLFYLGIYFRYPIMLLKKQNTFSSFKSSIDYFKKNPKHVALVWLITTVTLFITNFLVSQITQYFFSLTLLVNLFFQITMIIYRFRSLRS